MPPHRVYVELFLGSGAILRNKRPAEVSIGIDIDERVVTSWRGGTTAQTDIQHGDAFDFLRLYKFDRNHLVYADPPYLPSTRRKAKVYRHELTEADHVRLLEMLVRLPCDVMISGYPSDLYDGLLCGWKRTEFQAGSQVGLRREVIWHNFEAPAVLHDYRHLGDTFRERERLKRKVSRWRRRLEVMPDGERQALLAAIEDLAASPPIRREEPSP